MAKLEYNVDLEVGDTVICIHMDDPYSPVTTGMRGTVKRRSEVFGETQYNVDWDNGSRLALISGVDKWARVPKKRTDESVLITTKKNFLVENFYKEHKDYFKYFNHRLFHQFMKKLRESGVANMFGSPQYLYMGRERIEHKHKYDDIPNEESYDDMLEMSEDVRNDLISGSMTYLEDNNKEVNPRSVSRVVEKFAKDAFMVFTRIAGGSLPT
jgi:hypothetical protein